MIQMTIVLAVMVASLYLPGALRAEHTATEEPYSFNMVHVKAESKCDICHPPTVDVDLAGRFLKSDLCLSCHEDTTAMMPAKRIRSRIDAMHNHPLKISPLDFDSRSISNAVYSDGRRYWISGPTGSLPLFGESRWDAVIECATCHDPHAGDVSIKLSRIHNRASRLCLVCHLNF